MSFFQFSRDKFQLSINTKLVESYYLKYSHQFDRYYYSNQRIEKFKYRNFIRFLTFRPLLKPKRRWKFSSYPEINIKMTDGTRHTCWYRSEAHMIRDYNEFHKFMKTVSS